jgi:hypothetical protein
MENVGLFYGHLEFITDRHLAYLMAIFGDLPRGNLVYIYPFWYILSRKIWQTRYGFSWGFKIQEYYPYLIVQLTFMCCLRTKLCPKVEDENWSANFSTETEFRKIGPCSYTTKKIMFHGPMRKKEGTKPR